MPIILKGKVTGINRRLGVRRAEVDLSSTPGGDYSFRFPSDYLEVDDEVIVTIAQVDPEQSEVAATELTECPDCHRSFEFCKCRPAAIDQP